MKSATNVIKTVFITLCILILSAAVLYEIYAIAEIKNNIDNCKTSSKSANAEYEIPVKIGYKLSAFDIHDERFTILCGCVKFSQCHNMGECLIFRNENRTLIASERYCSPVYYSYNCSPQTRKYTDEECLREVKRIAVRCIPPEISGGSAPEIKSYGTEGERFNARFSFKGKEDVFISIRNDTLSVVYFDARDIYFK